MALHRVSAAVQAVSFSVLALVGTTTWGAEEINQQVLQGVGVFNGKTTLDMRFDAPRAIDPLNPAFGERPPDFDVEVSLSGSASLVSCQRNGTRGMYCIYGKEVRRWAKPEEGGTGQPLFSCADQLLNLDRKRADPCTALAVSQNGALWVAGRRNSASVLIKVYEKDSAGLCELVSAGKRDPALNGTYCFKEFPRLRPVLNKLVVVEGEEGAGFDRGVGVSEKGVLGLDIRDAVTFSSMNPADAPIDLYTKTTWGLASRESLQDLTLLQTPSGNSEDPDNFLLLTTSAGRVLARQTDAGAVPLMDNTVFDLAADAKNKGAQCPPLPAAIPPHRYGVVASNKTGRIYATDRNHCRVLALEPDDIDDDGSNGIQYTKLTNVADGDPDLPGTPDLTLSTVSGDAAAGSYTYYSPDGVTVAPGIAFDLADEDCQTEFDLDDPNAGGCTVISVLQENTSGQPVAKPILRFASVDLNQQGLMSGPLPSRVVVFKIENVPDCRYILALDPADEICTPYAGAVITPDGKPAVPGEQFLDIEEMLPQEVRDQFTGRRVLPELLLISPSFRGRKDKGYFFGALFFVPEPDVVFSDTFDGEFDVAALLGSTDPADSRRCSLADLPDPPSYQDLLQFDVVTKTSEQFRAPGGPGGGLAYVDMMVNSDCGSTRIKGTTNSVYAYGLEPAYNPQLDDNGEVVPGPNDDDGVYARLVAKLLQDLEVVQTRIACVANEDQPGSLPLSDCGSLNTSLRVTRDKFDKCLEAAVTPQTSLLDRACNAFETQFLSYQTAVSDLPANTRALDPGNRIGELEARLTTIWLVYRERFLPSVPPEGFTDP